MTKSQVKIALGIFIIVFVLYFLTLPKFNPSFADSDELITVAKIWGVAHPPGYPLYTVLAGIFGRLPLTFLSFAGRVNLLSAVLQSLTVGIFFLVSTNLFARLFKEARVVIFGSILASFLLAFAYSFWFHGLIAEVFPLNSFLNGLVILFLVLWKREYLENGSYRLLFYAGFFYGLALSNQQASLLLAPAYLLWVISVGKKSIVDFTVLIKFLLVGFLGFIVPYFYVLIAASYQPFINWENVHDFSSLYRLITRAVYAQSSPTGSAYFGASQLQLDQILIQTLQYLNYLKNNFSLVPFLIGLLGTSILIKSRKYQLFLFILLGTFGSGLFFAIWDPIDFSKAGNPDFATAVLFMRRFYTFSLFFFGLFVSFGLIWLLNYLSVSKKQFYQIALWGVIILTIVLGASSFNNIRQNDFNLSHNYSRKFLGSLDKNALLICITAENGCFQSYYLQEVEGFRSDVVIIPGDFKQRSLSQLKSQLPTLYKTTSTDQVPLIRDIIRWNINSHPIYIMGINPTIEWLSVLNIDGNPYYVTSEGCGVLKITKSFDVNQKSSNCASLEAETVKQIATPTNFYKDLYSDIFSSDRYWNSLIFLSHDCVSQSKVELGNALSLNPNLSLARAQLKKITIDAPQKTQCPYQTKEVTIDDIQTALTGLNQEKASDVQKVQEIKQQKIYQSYQLTMLDPKNIVYRLSLADLLSNSGFFALAHQEYQDVLVLDPSNQTAKKRITEIEQRI